MRLFYSDEGPLDTLLQIAAAPIADGDLVSKHHRAEFARLGWVTRVDGSNIITELGRNVVDVLRLARGETDVAMAELEQRHRLASDAADTYKRAAVAADEQVKQIRGQLDDLKVRLAGAEAANQRMRGYILRVQEDDVVREELIPTGDPEGAQQLVPKRKAERFDQPTPYTVNLGGTEAIVGYTDYRDRNRPQPKHWVTY